MKLKFSSDLKYLDAIKAKDLDTSEYILLTLGLLDSKSTEAQHKKNIMEIYQLYLDNNYEKAKLRIDELLQNLPIDPVLVNSAREKSKTLVDNPNKDDSRRYFETRFATYYAEYLAKENCHRSVIPLINAFNDELRKLPNSEQYKRVKSIQDYNDARQLILLAYLFNDTPDAEALKQQSPSYSNKDRTEKEPGIAYNKKGEKLEPLTTNPGIMKSTTSNFPDQLLENLAKIRTPDKYRLDEKKPGFASKHKEIPMVGNASGSIFGLTILLRNMMEKNKGSPTLERDVNNIIKIFSVEYIKDGYHSLHEMMEILKEPGLQTVYKKYNVNLDLTFAAPIMNDDKVAQGLFNYVKGLAPDISGKIKDIQVNDQNQLVINIASNSDREARIKDKTKVRDELFKDKLTVTPINVSGQWYFYVNIDDIRANYGLMAKIEPEPILKKAITDSQQYAMQLAMKRSMHEQLKHVTPRFEASLKDMGIFGGLQSKAESSAAPIINDAQVAQGLFNYVKGLAPDISGKIKDIQVNDRNQLVISIAEAAKEARIKDKEKVRDELFKDKLGVTPINVSGHWYFYVNIDDIRANSELMAKIEPEMTQSLKRLASEIVKTDEVAAKPAKTTVQPTLNPLDEIKQKLLNSQFFQSLDDFAAERYLKNRDQNFLIHPSSKEKKGYVTFTVTYKDAHRGGVKNEIYTIDSKGKLFDRTGQQTNKEGKDWLETITSKYQGAIQPRESRITSPAAPPRQQVAPVELEIVKTAQVSEKHATPPIKTSLKEMGIFGGLQSKADNDKVAQDLFNYVKGLAPEISGKIKDIKVNDQNQLVISIVSEAASLRTKIEDKLKVTDQLSRLGVKSINIGDVGLVLVNIADIRANSELMAKIESGVTQTHKKL